MRLIPLARFLTVLGVIGSSPLLGADGNRLAYLDEPVDPYYVGLNFPKLTTPMWVGEEGVEAVVILAIDDMRENALPRYEAFLRPILNRLKAIDGRAPVSIMTCTVRPDDPQLQAWIKEGVNLDVHTIAHPCPLLQKGDFAAAAKTYHEGVDLLSQVPNNRPVAFRMPCCDSRNTVSPRFFSEIFNQATRQGNFLSIDSSVFNILTPADKSLPRELVEDPDGREKFRKYLPFPSFVNMIENYPYPYVIGRLCWEFPCVVPSDWEAQNILKPNNPRTVEDLKAALDAIVLKQGVFTMVFHPHGWIENTQMVELIDHAVKKHGKKVKFLNFREALERIESNLTAGVSLRDRNGLDHGVRLLDLGGDGFLDVLIGNAHHRETRIWDGSRGRWVSQDMPYPLTSGNEFRHDDLNVRFGTLGPEAPTALFVRNGFLPAGAFWTFTEGRWREEPRFLAGLDRDGEPVKTATTINPDSPPRPPRGASRDRGVRFRDLDRDGVSELLVSNDTQNAVFAWSREEKTWRRLPFRLPDGAQIADAEGRDAGTRLLDLDEDGHDDVIVSRAGTQGVHLFESMERGWSRTALHGQSDKPDLLPFLVQDGRNQGFWAHSRGLWWQNENTASLPDLVDRRSFNDLLREVEPRSKSPEAALRSIRVRPGFQVETVAQEPLVEDPIAFDWDADGKLWVVEMGDYPLGIDGKGKHGGVVRVLEDTNKDGRYDKMTVFLDGLGFPTGILPWRKGVIVGCAPDIFYAEDTDGDGKADVRKVLFTGFREGNQQHRLNGFDLGLDGWVYGANGDSGGLVRSLATGKETPINGRDFRFKPDTGEFEAESGQTQFGRHRDDWGRWFGNNNPNVAWQYVFADADLKRNSGFAPRDVRKMLDLDTHVYPVSRTVPRFNDFNMVNRITSANSPTPYRDVLFGKAFENNLFVSEPVHNLVRRVVLEPEGATLKGHRFVDEQDREFLASSDNWFRPTMMKTGPDGALWIADMYRYVIEHPEWIPDDWEKRLDLRAGHDKGRLYRVYPVDRQPRAIPRLGGLDTAGLVRALESPNGWQRDTAQRLLLHRNDRSAIEPLRALAGSSATPQVRVQALWTLSCLDALTEADVRAAMSHPEPLVRVNAIQAGRRLLPENPRLVDTVARLSEDPDAQVRFAVALALGDGNTPAAAVALARIARRDATDPWIRAAVLCSAAPHAANLLAELFAQGGVDTLPSVFVEALFATAGASDQGQGWRKLVDLLATPGGPDGRFAAWQFSALAGLLDAVDRSNLPLAKRLGDGSEGRHARDALDLVFASARKTAADPTASETDRGAAVVILGRQSGHETEDRDQLASLLRPQVPAAVQQSALSALARIRDPRVPELLLAGWKGHAPALRTSILDVLLSRGEWAASLVSSLEDTCVPAAEIDPVHRERLLRQRDPALRKRAETLFATTAAARSEVLDRYRSALTQPGDAVAGALAFKKVCATCHRFKGEGHEVGPDLAQLTDRSPEALFAAILDPNRAFEAKYAAYTVATRDGRVLTGLVAAETGTSVTLLGQDRKEEVVLRADIEQLAATGQSLMPEGIEKDLTPEDLANLIAFLRN